MSRNSTSKEYAEIVSIAQSFHRELLSENGQWAESPFAWIKFCSSRAQLTIGEKIVSSWLALHDFNIERSPDAEADRLIEGKRTLIKFSTLWRNGTYSFQQIRDEHYEIVLLFGISPNDAHCWVVSKSDIERLLREGSVRKQIKSESSPLEIRLTPDGGATSEDKAMSKFGNGLHDALVSISRLTGYTPKDLIESLDA